ncbi:MAG TPA: hypothetical protein VK435_07465 [Thermodesulfovibrionales bacterium]|nr:hypothetical protein [Thermodesulfovibrionales bacterium]
MILNDTPSEKTHVGRLSALLERGKISREAYLAAEEAVSARGIDIEKILVHEQGIAKCALLQALSDHYKLAYIEYDERLPVPPELLESMGSEALSNGRWFPVIQEGNTVIVASCDPEDTAISDRLKTVIKTGGLEFRVALLEDVQWFIQDFLNGKPGALVGTDRTNLAFWRNTMAHWRTRLACYRSNLAKGRTNLSFMRWGLGIIALSNILMRTQPSGMVFYWLMVAAGVSLSLFGLIGYLKIRRRGMRPPGIQTLVEVTSATLQFLEEYHSVEGVCKIVTPQKTMLGRLADFLGCYSTILKPTPSYKERIHLARERNVLAAHRTVASCYRTIASRARTGLSFFRTGVALSSLGFGLINYFGFSLSTAFDAILVIVGLLMIIDGIMWYWPVRKEQAESPRYSVPDY